ncbi:MAG TPA: ABC transporter ATP-binding protein, partial [Candidatus Marinimicrobia bacterium]|nr:ABC transporter ATP-binding protein [Candidatus Neomarinimicrobiota bacterium]
AHISQSSINGIQTAMIFQDPLNALNPVLKVGTQILEGIKNKVKRNKGEVVRLLNAVGIDEPEKRYYQYPHEFSGGMRQRVLIAIALARDPDLLIADEPTTALDVTIQAQIIDLLKEFNENQGVSILFISHDLSLVKSFAQRTMVMYAGRIVESAPTDVLFSTPQHPYTKALIQLSKMKKNNKGEFSSIPGVVPLPLHYPTGCRFHPRCTSAIQECAEKEPDIILKGDHSWACPIT